MTPRQIRSSWLPAVGLFGPRQPFAAGLLSDYLMFRRGGLQGPPYAEPSPAALLGIERDDLTAGGDGAGSGSYPLLPSSSPVPAPTLEVARV